MTYAQEDRALSLDSPLDDELMLQRIRGREALSELFQYELECFALTDRIDVDALIGQAVTAHVRLGDRPERLIHGHVVSFTYAGHVNEEERHLYRATIVPFLWFLTRTSDCRIFQGLTIPEIVEEIFREHGFRNVRNALTERYEPLDYCVQYRESTYDFVARLLEEAGIFTFYEHEPLRHVLVLADSPSTPVPCPDQRRATWAPQESASERRGRIKTMERTASVRSGRYALGDWNYETPSVRLNPTLDGAQPFTVERDAEQYDYPGRFRTVAQGDRVARMMSEEDELQRIVYGGTSTCTGFLPGFTFQLEEHDRRDWNRSYLLTSVTMEASIGDTYRSGAEGRDELVYENTFVAILPELPYRPARRTRKPIVHGSQTAIVVGKDGEEIWTDKLGRVKVLFHWDRRGKGDEHSSCWVRVKQSMAGKGWGSLFLPRVGQEVVVEFLEGDPDRPLITGCVYNAENVPPYGLPKDQTRSGIKTCSSKDGEGFNELRFEDATGKEQVYLHAQRDFDLEIENDVHIQTRGVHHQKIDKDRKDQVGGSLHETIDKTHKISIGADENVSIGGKEAKKVGGAFSLDVGGSMIQACGGSRQDSTSGTHTIKASKIVLEATSAIELVCGGSTLKITSGGIEIQTGGGVTVMGSKADVTASMITLSSAMVDAAGVVKAQTFLAQVGIVSPSYSPGAGNVM
ncbi:MAG: type VI secretion system tip protein VgrG [Planctomycetes bacterium]|nr:type VI secretion system tip protein VgrG [Planctomycetota bacterium]